MVRANVALTLVHVLVAFTPLYDLTVVRIMDVPADVVEPARIGLMIMTPWTAAIGYRRFQQGVLIRFGCSGAVWYGTAIRLVVNATTLVLGYLHGGLAGIVVATTAVSAGVIVEAVYAGIRVRPVVREHLSKVDPEHEPLVGRAFVGFYVPLAMTPLIALVVQPIGAAAISRMPVALASLAVWPVMSGLVFIFQTFGMAFSEVVVALIDERGARRVLWRFTLLLTFASTALLLLVAVTPLASLWFGEVSGLSPELTALAASTVWIALPMAGSRALQSWYQGVLVGAQRTGPITESVLVFLVVCSAILWWGARGATAPGLHVALWAFSIARVVQTVWLWWRSRAEVRALPV
jgi:Na+-driven multidrug efflux pump